MISLVIMAAGLGSRYKNGIKQLEKVGPNNETIMEYSVISAKKSGIEEVIFILRKDIFTEFKEVIGNKIEKIIKTRYVFQEVDKIPNEFKSDKRIKPWGTGHAILMLEEMNNPFIVINADDYYGDEGFKNLYNFLTNVNNNSYNYCMSGFILKNTLSDNGGVSRGICKVSNGYLEEITETYNITTNSDINMNSIVSMNMWGFTPTILKELKIKFDEFLKKNNEELSKEFLLSNIIDELIKTKKIIVKVLISNDKWYGITYSEDLLKIKKEFVNKS